MDAAYTLLTLPSRYLVYNGVSEIGIRTLKGKDEKIISEISLENFDKKFTQVLDNVITGIKSSDLTLGDRKYIMLWLAINSFSKDFPIEVTCDNCLGKTEQLVDLSRLEVIQLPDGFKEPTEIALSNNIAIKLRLLRVADEIKISEAEKAGQNTWLYRYALSIVDEKMNALQKVQMLEEMSSADIARIRAWHDEVDHGPNMNSNYVCSRCGGEGVMPVPFRIEMLFPIGKVLRRNFRTSMQADILHASVSE